MSDWKIEEDLLHYTGPEPVKKRWVGCMCWALNTGKPGIRFTEERIGYYPEDLRQIADVLEKHIEEQNANKTRDV